MKNGLKLFQNFDKLYLEVCITDKDRQRFEKMYITKASENPKGQDGYFERRLNNKQEAWGIEYRIYFKTSKLWVLDSLKKLGYYVEKPKHMIAIELDKAHPQHGYMLRVASTELFWWLVDYGYRLGENNAIPYEFYEMRKTLQTMSERKKQIIPNVDIKQIEILSPVCEAQMLVA